MSYVVESASSRRARRRRRTAITLLVVVAALAGAFYVAASYWKSPPPSSATAPTCTSSTTTSGAATGKATGKATTKPTAKAPTPGQITVNVYNGTTRAGLAGDTAKLVKSRGFVVGTVANDPLGKSVTAPAEIRYGQNGKAAGAVVATLVSGAKPVLDARADASVDLVLGSGFKALAAAPKPTSTATPTC